MFGSEVRLLTVEEAFGVSPGCSKDEILITSLRSVQVFDLSLTRSTNNWCVARKHIITSKAIYDVATSSYYAIINSDILVKWTLDDNRLGKEDQLVKLTSPASALITTPSQTLILHENGNLSSLNQLEEYFWTFSKDNGKILHKSFTCENTHTVHVGYVTELKGCFRYLHVVINLGEENDISACRVTQCDIQSEQLPVGLSLNECSQRISIAIAWGDGVLSHCYSENIVNWKFSGVLNMAGFKKPFGLTSYKDETLCFYNSAKSGLACVSYSRKFDLEMSNKQFNILNATQIDFHTFDKGIAFVAGSAITLLPGYEQLTLAAVATRKTSSTNEKKVGEILKWTSDGLQNYGNQPVQNSTNIELQIETFLNKGNFKNAIKLLHSSSGQTVPESLLVNILTRYLPKDGFELNSNFLKRDKIIDSVIAVRIDRAFLIENVTKFSNNQLLRLLAYLFSRFKSNLPDCVEFNPEFIIDWIAALIDGNFFRLVTMHDPPVVELYKELKLHVGERCVSAWEEIETIREIVLTEKAIDAQKYEAYSNSRDYDIHVLTF
ncbi:hypothetical protein CHUAL_013181 [Chamberlinius hualienensis]